MQTGPAHGRLCPSAAACLPDNAETLCQATSTHISKSQGQLPEAKGRFQAHALGGRPEGRSGGPLARWLVLTVGRGAPRPAVLAAARSGAARQPQELSRALAQAARRGGAGRAEAAPRPHAHSGARGDRPACKKKGYTKGSCGGRRRDSGGRQGALLACLPRTPALRSADLSSSSLRCPLGGPKPGDTRQGSNKKQAVQQRREAGRQSRRQLTWG